MIVDTLVAAQSLLYNTGKSRGGSIDSSIIVIGTIVVVLIIIAIVRNAGRSSGSSSSFNKAAFRRAARAAGLAEEDLRFLEEYGRALGLTNPDFAFRNPQRLDAFFKDAYRQIEKTAESEADAEDRKARLFAARESLTHASAKGGSVRSTRQLGRGTPLTFIAPGEESYPSVILAVEPSGLAVEPVSDSYGEALRFRRGTKLSCYFYAKGHQGYQFATRVLGWEKIGGKDAMVLAHNESVSALPARRYARREMKAPCSFYRVSVTAGTGKGKGKSKAKVENIPYPGTIVDISAGGLGIQTANPLLSGEFVKIVFNTGGGAQSAFAKVLRMNKARNLGGIMHMQFIKISRQGLNAVLSYVYGYAD
jgi:c-di-GMP-binding flagellar brake protein YcgR